MSTSLVLLLPIPTCCYAVTCHARNTGFHLPRFNFNSLGKKSTSLQTWIIRPSVKLPMVGWMTPHAVLCCASSLSRVWLFSIPWTVAHQAPLFMGILLARILEWVAYPFSRGSSWPRNPTRSPALQADSLLTEPSGKPKWHLTPPKRYTPLEPGKLTLFGKSVFADVIKL